MGKDGNESDEEMRRDGTSTTTTSKGQDEADLHLPPEARGLIGHQLRQEYRRVLSEPLPKKFTTLLEELAKSDPKVKSEPKA